ncbi:hypothetical protein EGW08_003217 [Elysia chlorotica]|uniref:Cytochrome P450 n=1 Tax=Elysia chlorotica TaxID=188477 RepID=A0A433U5D6_ELYCH|nr:hypothetical protein EGW08_003217 [Elysia chlorotica]
MLFDVLCAMFIPWTLAGTALVLLVYYAWTKTRLKYEGSNIPPFPAPAKPFLGHTMLMKGDVLENFDWMRKKAGDIFSLNILGQHLVVVHGYENIREVLVTHAEVTLDRPVDMSSQVLREENHGLFSSRGANWKEQRAVTHSILREFGMGKNLMEEKVAAEVQVFLKTLAGLDGKPVDLSSITSPAVCNIICSMAIGERFDYNDEYFRRMMENSNAFFVNAPPVWVFNAAAFFRMLPGDMFGIKEWEARITDLHTNFCKFQVNKVKEKTEEGEEPKNFIAAYLQEMNKRAKGEKATFLDEPNLVSIIKSLLVAGTETSSTTINWCVLYCLHHPRVQEKVFEEIQAHVGTSRPPSISDMSKLRYLTAVIRETQRLCSVGPISARVVTDSFQLGGFLIPKDSQVMLNYVSAHQDEDVWENPKEFYPERFLDADGELVKRNELVPYGVGRRVCVGEALARIELDLFLAAMFQKFQFKPEDPTAELPPLKGYLSLTLSPEPFKVRLLERKL